MPQGLHRSLSKRRSRKAAGGRDVCSVMVRIQNRSDQIGLTRRVAISWRMSITSRAALRRTSTDACSAGIVNLVRAFDRVPDVVSCGQLLIVDCRR